VRRSARSRAAGGSHDDAIAIIARRSPPVAAGVATQRLADLSPDRVDWVECGHRLLEDHRHQRAAQVAQGARREPPGHPGHGPAPPRNLRAQRRRKARQRVPGHSLVGGLLLFQSSAGSRVAGSAEGSRRNGVGHSSGMPALRRLARIGAFERVADRRHASKPSGRAEPKGLLRRPQRITTYRAGRLGVCPRRALASDALGEVRISTFSDVAANLLRFGNRSISMQSFVAGVAREPKPAEPGALPHGEGP
jgi:hypothetical protein